MSSVVQVALRVRILCVTRHVATKCVRVCVPRYACYLTLLKKRVGDTERLEVPMFFGEDMRSELLARPLEHCSNGLSSPPPPPV